MSIAISCPHCSAKGNVPDNMLGQSVRCPKCKKTFPITAEEPPKQNVRASAPAPTPPASSGFDFASETPTHADDGGGDLPDPYAEREADPQEEPAEEEEAPVRRSRAGSSSGGGGIVDFLMFRSMIAPTVILVLFYVMVFLGCLGTLGSMAFSLTSGNALNIILAVVGGTIMYILSVLFMRIWCEILLVMFRHYETSKEIRDVLKKNAKP